jgi:hypothetical protein
MFHVLPVVPPRWCVGEHKSYLNCCSSLTSLFALSGLPLALKMDNLTRSLDSAIGSNDYNALAGIFQARSMQTLGQGEQRSLAGYFVRAAVASGTFLPAAFASPEVMHVVATSLGNLPSAVESAADNKLRQMLFDYKVNEEEDYSGAARVLAGMRMEDVEGSTYYMTAADRCDGKSSKHDDYVQKRKAPTLFHAIDRSLF